MERIRLERAVKQAALVEQEETRVAANEPLRFGGLGYCTGKPKDGGCGKRGMKRLHGARAGSTSPAGGSLPMFSSIWVPECWRNYSVTRRCVYCLRRTQNTAYQSTG
jgi:hypothetical protein